MRDEATKKKVYELKKVKLESFEFHHQPSVIGTHGHH